MSKLFPITFLTLAALAVCTTPTSNAQAPARSGTTTTAPPLQACSLLTPADVEQVTGQCEYGAPESMSLAGGAGSACTFTMAQVVLFAGAKAEEHWNALVKHYGHEHDKRYPVSGLGDRAYFFFPKPRSQYEDTSAFLVVHVGRYTVGLSIAADAGQSAESVQPQVLALAQIVVAKLR